MSTAGPSPNQSDIQVSLRNFLVGILPTGVEVIEGQDNRVPEPAGEDFVVFWPTRRDRISTNVHEYLDVRFIGAIAATTLTVSTLDFGTVGIGNQVFGVGMAAGTIVLEQLTGPAGGVGTYKVNNSQSISAEVMGAGLTTVKQATKVAVQLDVHGPSSADNAQRISTLFRDDFAVEQFAAGNSAISPLYADDPKQVPFVNAEEQYEWRYVIESLVQANQTVSISQEFADRVVAALISVDAAYPP